MTRIVVASRLWDFSAKEWDSPTELYDFSNDDEALAKAKATSEYHRRVAELVRKHKDGDREGLPWLEQIIVCPMISGIGRGGGNHFALSDRLLTLTVGLE